MDKMNPDQQAADGIANLNFQRRTKMGLQRHQDQLRRNGIISNIRNGQKGIKLSDWDRGIEGVLSHITPVL